MSSDQRINSSRQPFARRLALASLAIGLCFAAGCSQSKTSEPRAEVRGAVTLDGKPLSRATILFRRDVAGGTEMASASIVDGQYAITRDRGPKPGPMRVEIRPEMLDIEEYIALKPVMAAATPEGELATTGDASVAANPPGTVDAVAIPAKYQGGSTLSADLVAEGENVCDFQLTSK